MHSQAFDLEGSLSTLTLPATVLFLVFVQVVSPSSIFIFGVAPNKTWKKKCVNHQITQPLSLERKGVWDVYWLKTPPVPLVAPFLFKRFPYHHLLHGCMRRILCQSCKDSNMITREGKNISTVPLRCYINTNILLQILILLTSVKVGVC